MADDAQTPPQGQTPAPPVQETSSAGTPTIAEAAAQATPPVETVTPPTPVDKVTAGDVEKAASATPGDTVTLASPTASSDAAPASVLDTNEADDEHVAALKIQLASFAKMVSRPGSEPKDFKEAAKMAVQFTKYVMQYPKVPVLNALLSFFEENINGVCAPTTYMKGSTTVSMSDEREVGFLYNLFADMAHKTIVRINNAQIINVFKKPEIGEYYNRKMAGLKQALEQTNAE